MPDDPFDLPDGGFRGELLAGTVRRLLGPAARDRTPTDDRDRADQDGATLARALTRTQLERYTRTPDRDTAARMLADERWRALQERPRPVAGEVAEAEALLADAAPVWRAAQALAHLILLLTGSVFLICGILGIFWPTLMIVSAVALAVATLAWTARGLAHWRVRRAQTRTLLEWASHRPGQLGRGLPGIDRSANLGRATSLIVYCLVAIGVGVGAAAVIIAVLLVLIQVFFHLLDGLPFEDGRFILMMFVGGAVMLLLTWAGTRLWGRVAHADLRLVRAVERFAQDTPSP